MYAAEDYFWGWVVYASGAVCLLYTVWYLLRNLRFSSIRHVFLMLASVFLLTPVTAYIDDSHLAPAFFVSLYEGLVANPVIGFQRGAAPIVALMTVSLFLYMVLRLVVWQFKKRRSKS